MGLLDLELFDEIRRMNKRQFYYQILVICMVVTSALMLWKGFIVFSYSESPLVVVLSGSMEPAFYRGDVLYLTNYPDEPLEVGDIVVFKVENRDIPIVHRIIKLHKSVNGTVKFLTKGDNNPVHDRGLYAPGQDWLSPSQVMGRARGFAPHLGQVTIIMNDNPKFKVSHLIYG
ncbi:Signal peptidase I [Fasciolopsis buskii]|uniref:Signal peptidase complex catalytic subunit SEC11 n=1 Tax=Fasciolopsis buskii TaxID=27845 RepID=A0A8E0S5P2_9TREM|nr:Signal peptidase I [Fasciolopsis buski]